MNENPSGALTRGALTKKKIIDTSLQLFSVKGYFNTSMNDILEATNLTKGGLYSHFKSKEDIWLAAYEEAVRIWKAIVFKDLETIDDPVRRIQKALDSDFRVYFGENVFEGGCIFLNLLVELSGQEEAMSRHVLTGILGFSSLIRQWLAEAQTRHMLKPGIDISEVADFIIVTLCGCAALYGSTKDRRFIDVSLSQVHYHLEQIRA